MERHWNIAFLFVYPIIVHKISMLVLAFRCGLVYSVVRITYLRPYGAAVCMTLTSGHFLIPDSDEA